MDPCQFYMIPLGEDFVSFLASFSDPSLSEEVVYAVLAPPDTSPTYL
jgi:hypothetical protein